MELCARIVHPVARHRPCRLAWVLQTPKQDVIKADSHTRWDGPPGAFPLVRHMSCKAKVMQFWMYPQISALVIMVEL